MLTFDLSNLLGKLNETSTIALTAAIASARARGHKFVQLEHWLMKLLDVPNSDLGRIMRYFRVDEGQFTADLLNFVERLPADDAHFPSIHPQITDAVCQAWLVASLSGTGFQRIRSGHLVIACLGEDAIADKLCRVSAQLRRIKFGELRDRFEAITGDFVEARPAEAASAFGPGTPSRTSPAETSATPALDRFTIDLTALAREGRIDPVLGRDDEIRQIVDIPSATPAK